jgi:cytoskeletal protein CcmA (bactofilin family)
MAYKFQNGDARLSGSTTFEDALAGLQSLDIDGQATLASAVVEGALDVDGATTLDGLNVSEVASFAADITASAGLLIGAELHVDGAATLASAAVEGAFDVDGATTLDGLTVAEAAQFDAGVAIDGAIDANSTSNFQGDMQLQAALDVDGVATLASANVEGALDVDGATTLDGLTVAEAAVFSAAVQIDGAIDANSTSDFQGAMNLQAGITIAGASDLNSTLDVSGDTKLAASGVGTQVRGDLTVDEAASFSSTISGSSSLQLGGAATIAGAADLNSTLDVSGDTKLAASGVGTQIRGDLTVDEAASFQDVTVDGALDANSTADFQGDVNLQADLDVAGASTLAAASFSGAIDANSTAAFQGDVNLQANLDVAGATVLASAKVSDLTSGRVVFAGSGGELEDSAALVYDGSALTVLSKDAWGNAILAKTGSIAVMNAAGDGALAYLGNSGVISGSSDLKIGGDAEIGGELGVEGAAEFYSTVQIDEDLTVDGESGFGGIVVISGSSDVGLNVRSKFTGGASVLSLGNILAGHTGGGNHKAHMNADGSISGSSNLQMGGNLISAGALDINGPARSDIANDLKVGGDLIIAGDIHFSGSLEIDGDLQVDGDVLFTDVAGTMAIANDALYFRDADDGKLKSYSWDSLMDSVAGAGLTNTNGQLSADGASAPNAIGDANATLAEGFNYGSSALTANRAWALPAPQEVGDTVHVKAPAGCSATNYIAISGGTIDGDLTELRLESPYAAVSLICVNVASDLWRIY